MTCGATPLYFAAQGGHTAVAAALIHARADVNAAMTGGATPLYAAAQNGHTAVAAALIHARADVNAASTDGTTPLYVAAQEGHTAVVAALIHARADVNAATTDGATPLFIAAFQGHLDCALALVAAGASLKVVARGSSLRDMACVGEPWPGGTPAQFMARLDAADRGLTRAFLLRARTWLDGREGGAVLLRANMRLCYGCQLPRPKDGGGATTCPRGCGDPANRAPDPDGWYRQMFHEIWYCSPACVAAAAGRHRPVCDQTLRWAAAGAAAALPPGTRVRVVGLVSKPELNGAEGGVAQPRDRAEAAELRAGGRVKVVMAGAGEGAKPLALKYANTELMS